MNLVAFPDVAVEAHSHWPVSSGALAQETCGSTFGPAVHRSDVASEARSHVVGCMDCVAIEEAPGFVSAGPLDSVPVAVALDCSEETDSPSSEDSYMIQLCH